MKNAKTKFPPKHKPKHRAPTLRERIRDLERDVGRLQEWLEALRSGCAATTASCTGSGELDAKRPRFQLRGDVTYDDLESIGLGRGSEAVRRLATECFEMSEPCGREYGPNDSWRVVVSGPLKGYRLLERFVKEVKP